MWLVAPFWFLWWPPECEAGSPAQTSHWRSGLQLLWELHQSPEQHNIIYHPKTKNSSKTDQRWWQPRLNEANDTRSCCVWCVGAVGATLTAKWIYCETCWDVYSDRWTWVPRELHMRHLCVWLKASHFSVISGSGQTVTNTEPLFCHHYNYLWQARWICSHNAHDRTLHGLLSVTVKCIPALVPLPQLSSGLMLVGNWEGPPSWSQSPSRYVYFLQLLIPEFQTWQLVKTAGVPIRCHYIRPLEYEIRWKQRRHTCGASILGAWLLTPLGPCWACAKACWDTSISWPLSLRINIIPVRIRGLSHWPL